MEKITQHELDIIFVLSVSSIIDKSSLLETDRKIFLTIKRYTIGLHAINLLSKKYGIILRIKSGRDSIKESEDNAIYIYISSVIKKDHRFIVGISLVSSLLGAVAYDYIFMSKKDKLILINRKVVAIS
jgi:hypothetical protein